MKPVRVALSGSGFKFPAHVGALVALRDAGYEPIEIAGTSGGSIIAALYATGMSLDEMHTLCLEQDWSGMLSFSPWSALTKLGYCSGNTLQKWLEKTLNGHTFSDTRIPLTVVASDVAANKPFVFSSKETPGIPVSLACRASASIPFVYAPVAASGALLMDGGVCNNMPVDLLADDDIENIGIHLTVNHQPMKPGVFTAWGVASRLLDLMLDSSEAAHAEIGVKTGSKIVMVDTGFVDGLDRNMSLADRTALVSAGYDATMNLWRQV